MSTRRKKQYIIDGITYDGPKLFNYHIELKKCMEAGLIASFSLAGEVNKKSKYHAKKVIIDGFKFDSVMESRFYLTLLALKRNHKILHFERQKKFVLLPSFKKDGKTVREITYIADFVVLCEDNSIEVIDIKGIETPEFKLKKKLFEYKYPSLHLICYQYSSRQGVWETLERIKVRRKQEVPKQK